MKLLTHEWLRTRGTLGLAAGMFAAVVAVPAVQLTLAADNWRSGYGRIGYFTHSLPIRGSRIYWAKLAWAMLASLAAIVLTVALALLAWWSNARRSGGSSPSWSVLTAAWSTVTDVTPGWMIAGGVALLFGSILVWPVHYYFSISVGHERRLAGLGAGGPVVVFVLLYVATQALSLPGMVLIPIGVGETEGETPGLVRLGLLSELAAGSSASNDVMAIGFVIALVVLAVFCLWRTARSWNHKVSLG